MKKIKRDSFIRRRWTEIKKNGLIFNVLGLIPFIWGAVLVGLLIWALLVSFAEPNWYLDNSNTFLVKEFTLNNYKTAIENFRVTVNAVSGGIREAGFWEMTFNSVWFTAGATAVKMLSTICFAYAIARFEFPGRKLLYGFVVLQMMLPVYGQTASNYSLLNKLGLVNTPWFILALGAGHVREVIDAIKEINPDIMVEQAAGITNGQQVYDFIMAGSEAAGAASGIMNAEDPLAMIDEMIAATRRAADDLKKQGK